jgi:uncharacterized UBP type Zn finger protein
VDLGKIYIKERIKSTLLNNRLYCSFPDQQQQQQQHQQQSQPQEPPEVRFRDQLAQLEEMGFSEKQANVRALLATGGNVQAAIEYLFSSN